MPILEGGRRIGLASNLITLQHTLGAQLKALIEDGGDLTEGGVAVLYTSEGQIRGMSELEEVEDQPESIEGLRQDSATAKAIRSVVAAFGQVCPENKHFLDDDRLIEVFPVTPEEYGAPPFQPRWCGLVSVPRSNCYRSLDLIHVTDIIVGVLGGLGMLLTVALLVFSACVAYMRQRQLARCRKRDDMRRVMEAEFEVRQLTCPMVLIPATCFLEMETLECNEVWRDRGKLVQLDSMKDVREFKHHNFIVFISHQWLGYTLPRFTRQRAARSDEGVR